VAGHVIYDAGLTVNGTDISGQANQVEMRLSRAEISWQNYGDAAMNKDAGIRDEQIRIAAVYTDGATEAVQTLWDLYTGSDGGTDGTVAVTPIASGTTWTGVGKIIEMPVTVNMGEVGAVDVTFAIDGTIATS